MASVGRHVLQKGTCYWRELTGYTTVVRVPRATEQSQRSRAVLSFRALYNSKAFNREPLAWECSWQPDSNSQQLQTAPLRSTTAGNHCAMFVKGDHLCVWGCSALQGTEREMRAVA